ncbi:3-hydroxybutyryl-CoA dehydrogenase [Halobacteriales archaeon SW_12_71_31]|nr:MAG: 3-hydroxybutyryl-CoA dehydrogenase [Halobacteriales archaeon SW_12_71_31]
MYDISEIERVGVVGAGTMGAGIAQAAATEGYDVVMRDVERRFLDSGFESIEDSLSRFVDRDAMTESEAAAVVGRVRGTTDLDDLADCGVVVEAAPEDLDLKTEVFAELERVVDEAALLATNTSTLSITSIAAATETPGRVAGMHFMNPVPVMDGVEVVVGEHTSDAAVDLTHAVAADLGKETWEADDKPGFVTNRILMPWVNEGVRAYDEGVASKEDIDRGMTLGTNVPMGPLELADHIGLDVCLHATETLHEELGDRYAPAYLLKRKVAAGDLGKKTGRGFYEYD